jgi:hypothetical protein
MRALLLVFLSLWLNGCGVIFQTVIGWSSESQRSSKREHNVSVPGPVSAPIYRESSDGSRVSIGNAPLVDKVEYEVTETVEEPKSAIPMAVGTVLDVGIAVTGGLLIANASETDALAAGAGAGFGVLLLLYGGGAAIADLILTFVVASRDPEVTKHSPVGDGLQVTYVAEAGGPPLKTVVRVPWETEAKLHPGAVLASNVMTLPVTAPSPSNKVVAVMNLVDANAGDQKLACEPTVLRNTSDQLRIFVARTGLRTVDRGTQERALSEQVQEMKKESYKTCYDQSCQVELGKALAATHILRSQVTRFGDRCVLNSELIDLRTEVAVAAASSTGSCAAEGFLTMADQVAKDLGSSAK